MNIQDLLSRSIGKIVTHSRTGGGAGSIWVIELEDATSYTIGCNWRLECNGMIITTSWDDATALVGHVNKNVERLIGNKLLSYELFDYYDLKLYFENGFVVNLFCDVLKSCSEEDSVFYSNWDFCVPDQNIVGIITGHLKLAYTKCDDNTIIVP